MELLQKYLFIPLDIFKKNQHNKDRNNKRDAWLTLFSSDDPDIIMELLDDYPEFKDIYKEGYQICLNVEKVMEMFSEELYILDRNTEKFMFEEMQRELDEMRSKRDEMRNECDEMRSERNKMRSEYKELSNKMTKMERHLAKAQKEKDEIEKKMAMEYSQSIRNAVEIMRSLNLGDQEIVGKLCGQYHFNEKQAEEFL